MSELPVEISELPVEMFWYLPSRSAADALADDLQRAGHLIADVSLSAGAESGEPLPWLVFSVASRQELQKGEQEALASRYGGVFDGWGTYVGPAEVLTRNFV